jgi:hypothetical protein
MPLERLRQLCPHREHTRQCGSEGVMVVTDELSRSGGMETVVALVLRMQWSAAPCTRTAEAESAEKSSESGGA